MFPAVDLGGLERYRVRAGGGPVKLAEIDPRDRKGLPFGALCQHDRKYRKRSDRA